MNIVLCGIVVVLEMALGCGMFIRCYPERRFKNTFARIAEWVSFFIICGLYTVNDTLACISCLAVSAGGVVCGVDVFCFYRC